MKRRITNRGDQQKQLRQKMLSSARMKVIKGHQTPIRHAPGARRDDKPKKADKSKDDGEDNGEDESESNNEEEEEEEEVKFRIPYLSSQDIEPGNLESIGVQS